MMFLKSIVKSLPGVKSVVAQRNMLFDENHRLKSELLAAKSEPMIGVAPTLPKDNKTVRASDYSVKRFDHAMIPGRKD